MIEESLLLKSDNEFLIPGLKYRTQLKHTHTLYTQLTNNVLIQQKYRTKVHIPLQFVMSRNIYTTCVNTCTT